MKVEAILPNNFFPKLGMYVATCAHIEKMAWLLVVHSTGFDLNDGTDIDRILKLRKRTPDLISELGEVADRYDVRYKERLHSVYSRINDGITNRHIAIHGAWTIKEDGRYNVEYYNDIGSRKSPDWRAFNVSLSEEDLDAALIDANDILSELLKLYKDLGLP